MELQNRCKRKQAGDKGKMDLQPCTGFRPPQFMGIVPTTTTIHTTTNQPAGAISAVSRSSRQGAWALLPMSPDGTPEGTMPQQDVDRILLIMC